MHVACVLCIYVKSFKKTPSFTAVTSSGQTACPWRRRSSLSILALTALYKHTYLAAKSLSPPVQVTAAPLATPPGARP